MINLQGQVWTPQGWLSGRLVGGETVEAVLGEKSTSPGAAGRYLVPGFIDVHVHGGGGADVMDDEAAVRHLARFHARHGTTSLLATTITAPWNHIQAALATVQQVRDRPGDAEARVLGAHLEGPFIHPQKLGAQPPFTAEATPELVAEVVRRGVVRVVTLAPDRPGGPEAAVQFARAGVRVSLGHTLATAEQATAVQEAVRRVGGTVGGTHLFNAMTGLLGREPGVVGSLLADPEAYAEVILDGHHVHPTSFRSVVAAKPDRTLLITDAMRAAGMPDGQYDLGGQMTQVSGGQARLPGGSLAGSLLTMDEAVRQAVQAGLSLHQAVSLAGPNPARYLGLSDRGTLQPGQRADIVVLNETLQVEQVYIGGVPIIESDTIIKTVALDRLS